MTPLALIVLTLAAYRVTHMIVREEGPGGVFEKIRGKIDPNQKTWIGRGLNCPLCVSFWITGLFSLLTGATWIEWLACAGAIIPLNKWVMKP